MMPEETGYFTDVEAAEFTGRSINTIRRYRQLNTKPQFIRFKGRVLYHRDALLEFLASVQDLAMLEMRLAEQVEAGQSSLTGWLAQVRKLQVERG